MWYVRFDGIFKQERMVIMGIEPSGSRLWLINFYREQLSKFKKIGIGRRTEFGVKVTKKLIETTEKRLAKLAVVYERNVSHSALYQRKLKAERDGQTNGISNGIGAVAEIGKQDLSDI